MVATFGKNRLVVDQGPDDFEKLRASISKIKAMILLGVNAGLGNSDCASLPIN